MGEKRVLITGLNGFTGFHLAGELERAGYAIFGVADTPSNFPNCYQVNLLDKAGLARVIHEVKPTHVVHLAAIAFVGHGSVDDFYQVNVLGTRNLLEALATAASELKCVLLASSANIYGNTSEGMLSEDTRPNPANDYAVSKLAMEYMARLWVKQLPIVIVRPFNYTGVGQSKDFLLPKIVDHFRRRVPAIELGNLDVWRDFSDVRAVVGAYRSLLEVCPVGQVVNICSGRVHSLREVLAMVERLSAHTLEVRVNPAFVRANEVKTLSGDPGKLISLIGKQVTPKLDDTLAWMLEAKDCAANPKI